MSAFLTILLSLGISNAWATTSDADADSDSWRCTVLLGSHFVPHLDPHHRTWIGSNRLTTRLWSLAFMELIAKHAEFGPPTLSYAPDQRTKLVMNVDQSSEPSLGRDYRVLGGKYATHDEAVDPIFGPLEASMEVVIPEDPQDFRRFLDRLHTIEDQTEDLVAAFTEPAHLVILARHLRRRPTDQVLNLKVGAANRFLNPPRSVNEVIGSIFSRGTAHGVSVKEMSVQVRSGHNALEIFNERVRVRLELDPTAALLTRLDITQVQDGIRQVVSFVSPGIAPKAILRRHRRLERDWF